MTAWRPEPVHRDPAGTDHIVQLFDGVDSLADTVAEFLRDGWVQGHTLLVVATPAHWAATAERLVGLGVPIDLASRADGRLVVRGADETMGLFMRDGRPDAARFEASVGRFVGELVARGRPLRVFGEMVDVLAADGEYRRRRGARNVVERAAPPSAVHLALWLPRCELRQSTPQRAPAARLSRAFARAVELA